MDFSQALLSCKQSCKIWRDGWNGKGMYIVYKPGYASIPCNDAHAMAHDIDAGTKIKVLPYLEMKTAQGDYVPWLASQTDILAEDWQNKFTED